MSKSSINKERVPVSSMSEVQEFEDAKLELTEFCVKHSEIFSEYRDLVEQYNTALEAAEKAVRAKGVSCGPFDNYSSSVSYDASRMYEMLGEENFLKFGGQIVQRTAYEVDKEKVSRHILAGDIPEECFEEFQEVRRSYRSPKKLNAP